MMGVCRRLFHESGRSTPEAGAGFSPHTRHERGNGALAPEEDAAPSQDPAAYFFRNLLSASFCAVSRASAAFTLTSGSTPTPSQSAFE